MVGISLKMPEALAAEVAAVAHRKGVSKSALIREAFETFLSGDEAVRPRSALGLVADLVGSCEGPAGLSTNKKYMEGFGKGAARSFSMQAPWSRSSMHVILIMIGYAPSGA